MPGLLHDNPISASTSGLVAGVIVDRAGYSAAFLTLGAAAAIAVTVFGLAMPETAPGRGPKSGSRSALSGALADRGERVVLKKTLRSGQHPAALFEEEGSQT